MGKVIRQTPTSVSGTCVDNGILFGAPGALLKEIPNVTDRLGGAATLKSISFTAVTETASPDVDVFFFRGPSGDAGSTNQIPNASFVASLIANSKCLGKVNFPSVDADESIFITDVSNNEMYVSVKNNVDLVVESEENSQSIYYIGIARESVTVGSAGDFGLVFNFQ